MLADAVFALEEDPFELSFGASRIALASSSVIVKRSFELLMLLKSLPHLM